MREDHIDGDLDGRITVVHAASWKIRCVTCDGCATFAL